MLVNNYLLPKRALISVSDKTGITALAKKLQERNVEILSTGGTAKSLREAGITVKDVSQYTQSPEIMGGRVKTLHPKIHGGILARRGTDEIVMQENGIDPIDLVVVNLYPFGKTIARADVSLPEAIENIDIGGPSMLRSAAKNHKDVAVVVNPDDYEKIITALDDEGISQTLRNELAYQAFRHTANYDNEIANYFEKQYQKTSSETDFPTSLQLNFEHAQSLRYGENPHQKAAFYTPKNSEKIGLAAAKQHQGKELSYNNIADTDAALRCIEKFAEDTTCVIVKHANPCGIAIDENTLSAYEKANKTDPTSAFGGIIAFNATVDQKTAQAILDHQFVEVIIAPAYSEDALKVFSNKPNIRVLELARTPNCSESWQLQSIQGGLLIQQWDNGTVNQNDLKIVTARKPSPDEIRNLLFAWRAVQSVKSNAIIICKDLMTLGIGAGQTSRVYSSKIAVMKAHDEGFNTNGAVLASDAFFPFRDGVDTAAEAGIKAIIQPGGSIRDDEVIKAADEHGITMLFTNMRHFKH